MEGVFVGLRVSAGPVQSRCRQTGARVISGAGPPFRDPTPSSAILLFCGLVSAFGSFIQLHSSEQPPPHPLSQDH